MPAQGAQQVKSVSLEFTPDGGRDVRLRVTDRGGEVHVSLHSTDATLTGRLREGVQDLAGALASAGYDAEAWTPGDERHRQQPEVPPEPKRNKARAAGEDGDFAGTLSNPFEETR